jgi:tetratricopeptide (TPR) repeat protein
MTVRVILFQGALIFAFFPISALTLSPVAQAGKWTNEMVKFTEDDFMILPPLCRAKISQQSNREVQEYWTRRYGSNWGGMHHYCFGLKALNLAYRDFNNTTKREYFSSQAVNEFGYVLDRAEPDFVLRPEILIQRGRALVLSRSYDDAKQSFEEALKQNPKSVDAWVALSDLYSQLGKSTEAIKVLEQAIEVTGGEHKKITARLDDLKKKRIR